MTAGIDVQLVSMPYVALHRPSLGLSLLAATLREAQFSVHTEYANLRFIEETGIEAMRVVHAGPVQLQIGEWTFAGAAFPERESTPDELFRGVAATGVRIPIREEHPGRYDEALVALRQRATRFVETTARRIVARRPRIVGCSSTFEQHVASLALLRRIKELAPQTLTLMGGANCEGPMGWATLREFAWLDCVVSGEADTLMVPLCRELLAHGAHIPLDGLPAGALTRSHLQEARLEQGRTPVSRAVVPDLDQVPVPDFTDYFSALDASSLRDEICPGLLAETSRGCWWGETSHCTFCGLNGTGMRFRPKSPQRILDEFAELSSRWGLRNFETVDNIISMDHVRTLLPRLRDQGAPYQLFYETKSNLRRDQMQAFADAGIAWIQPGIESLHDELLQLMAKGSTAMTNVQMLKYARECGVFATWSLLHGFPGEEDGWHQEVAAWLPRIAHLQAPGGNAMIRYDRFSVYHKDQERFGLALEASPGYAAVYPLDPAALSELAAFFIDGNEDDARCARPGVRALIGAAVEWAAVQRRPMPTVLALTEKDDTIEIYDTRPIATRRRHRLTGIEAAIYRICDPAQREDALPRMLAERGEGVFAAAEVRAAVHSLDSAGLVLRLGGKILALATRGSVPRLPSQHDFPGGRMRGLRPPDPACLDALIGRLAAPAPISAAAISAL